MPNSPSENAKQLLVRQSYAVLSTHSIDCEGYPFGSVVPFVLDSRSRPIILISRLAQHTKNIEANPRVSLLVTDAHTTGFEDVQTCARLSYIADAAPLEDTRAVDRYYRYYPDARSYVEELDFDFYRVSPVKIRFIGGFGQIHWIPADDLCETNPFSSEAEADIIAHMNEDHADALVRYCEQARILLPESLAPQLAGIDRWGIHIRIGHMILRRDFDHPVESPTQVRMALIDMLRATA